MTENIQPLSVASSNSRLDSKRHLLSILGPVLLALACALFLLESWTPKEQMDDAFISYRYAQNFVDGHGLVFNRDERVEGYTNLSWTLMVAAGIRLGVAAPMAGHVLLLLSGLLLLWASFVYARRILPETPWMAGLAPLVLLATNSFACWTASGLETALFAAMTVMAFSDQLAGRRWRVSLWCIVAAMTRPEGVLLAATVLGWDWLRAVFALKRRTLKGAFRLALPALLFAAYILGHTAFRLYYYHDYVPNTFYAKVGGIPLSRGFAYLYSFMIDGPGFLLLPALLAVLAVPRFRLGFAYCALTAAYVVSVGGDVFRLGRFLLPVLPLLIAGAMAGSYWLFVRWKAGGLLLGMSLPLAIIWSLYGIWPHNADFPMLKAEPWPTLAKRIDARNHVFFVTEEAVRLRARELVELKPPVRLLATIGIGKLGYYAMELPILDLVGLTDRHIARSEKRVDATIILPGHQRTDAEYVLSRKPDIIWIPRKELQNKNSLPAVVDLWDQPDLEDEYYWDARLTVYRRKLE